MPAFYFAVLTFCNPTKSTFLAHCLAPLPNKTLNIGRFAAYLWLLLTASQLLLHLQRRTLSVCVTLLADDLLVGALWRNISSFLGLFSHTSCWSDPLSKKRSHLLTRAELTDGGSSPGQELLAVADCCWISCVPLQGISSRTRSGVLSAHSVDYRQQPPPPTPKPPNTHIHGGKPVIRGRAPLRQKHLGLLGRTDQTCQVRLQPGFFSPFGVWTCHYCSLSGFATFCVLVRAVFTCEGGAGMHHGCYQGRLVAFLIITTCVLL